MDEGPDVAAAPGGVVSVSPSALLQRCTHDVPRLSEALSGEPQDRGSIDESVDRGYRGGLGGQQSAPLTEPCVRGQHDGTLAVSGRDEAEQVVGCLRAEGLIRKLVQDQE